jgi:hypothetical protein
VSEDSKQEFRIPDRYKPTVLGPRTFKWAKGIVGVLPTVRRIEAISANVVANGLSFMQAQWDCLGKIILVDPAIFFLTARRQSRSDVYKKNRTYAHLTAVKDGTFVYTCSIPISQTLKNHL